MHNFCDRNNILTLIHLGDETHSSHSNNNLLVYGTNKFCLDNINDNAHAQESCAVRTNRTQGILLIF